MPRRAHIRLDGLLQLLGVDFRALCVHHDRHGIPACSEKVTPINPRQVHSAFVAHAVWFESRLPFVPIELPDAVDEVFVPLACAMPHVQTGNVHAALCEGLEHFWRRAIGTNGADDFGPPCAPEACRKHRDQDCLAEL